MSSDQFVEQKCKQSLSELRFAHGALDSADERTLLEAAAFMIRDVQERAAMRKNASVNSTEKNSAARYVSRGKNP